MSHRARVLTDAEMAGIQQVQQRNLKQVRNYPSLHLRRHLWSKGYIAPACFGECCWKLTRRGRQALARAATTEKS